MEENQNGVVLTEREESVSDIVAPELESVPPKTTKHEPRHGKPCVKKPLWVRILGWTGVGIGTLVAAVVIFFLVVFYSPWTHDLRDSYITMTYNTSNKWLATLFFSDATLNEVLNSNTSEPPQVVIQPDIIQPPKPEDPPPEFSTSEKYKGEVIYDDGEVQIVQFSGKTSKGEYTARLMQVKDPSRVFLGVTNQLGKRGQLLADMCATNDALGGINAGGCVDEGGVGSGGTPTEMVIKNSEITIYEPQETYNVIALNEDNVLILGEYTEEQARQLKLRDGISWGKLHFSPFLIVNGEMAQFKGNAGGYDPRSAIGQRADGVLLLLVVDGSEKRSVDGANMEIVADIMKEYGAVNAANLDGGTSSAMALNGQLVSNNRANPAIAHRGRYLATGLLVKNATPTDTQDTTSSTTAQTTTPTAP